MHAAYVATALLLGYIALQWIFHAAAEGRLPLFRHRGADADARTGTDDDDWKE